MGQTRGQAGGITPSGIELAYAERLTDFTPVGTSYVDVTGLSVTFTGRKRPVIVEAWGFDASVGTVNANIVIEVLRVSDSKIIAGTVVTSGAVNNGYGWLARGRMDVVEGTEYTLKVRAKTSAGVGTLWTFSAYSMALQVVEI